MKGNSEKNLAWTLILEEKGIGKLTNENLDEQSEFWSEFDLIIFNPKYHRLKTDPDYWYSLGIKLQDKNKKHIEFSCFLVAIRNRNRETDKIAIRILPA